jgi:hypothetical protein
MRSIDSSRRTTENSGRPGFSIGPFYLDRGRVRTLSSITVA